MRVLFLLQCVMPPVMSYCTFKTPLEMHLRKFRSEQAKAQAIPCTCVFSNSLLKTLAHTRPLDMSALSVIKGMGPERCTKYGHGIITIMKSFSSSKPPAANSRSKSPVAAKTPSTTRPPQKRTAAKAPENNIATKKPNVIVHHDHAKKKQLLRAPVTTPRTPEEPGVYILELAHGRVYVGKSYNIDNRISQHITGAGAAFTKAFPPTGNRLPRLGNISGSGDAAERDETLRYMFLRGINNVRGWKYVTVSLSSNDFNDAEANIRELFDLCRRCGNGAHFVSTCKFEFDRLGRRITQPPSAS